MTFVTINIENLTTKGEQNAKYKRDYGDYSS